MNIELTPFTHQDITKIINISNDPSSGSKIKNIVYEKLKINNNQIDAIKSNSNKDMMIDKNKYSYIYVISDIHADFRRFVMLLLKSGAVSLSDSTSIISDKQTDIIIHNIINDEMEIYNIFSQYNFNFKMEE